MPRSLFKPQAPAYAIRPLAQADDSTEILLYDEISMWGISARQFVTDLKAVDTGTIHLRINSPGGDVFDGVAIYNALLQHPARIVCHVDAIAASIASLILLAGDEVLIAQNAFVMIHDMYTCACGTAQDFRALADRMDKIGDATLLRAYMDATGEDEAQVRAWMSAETWFEADEAVEAGFADAVEEREAVAARFDLSSYRQVPAALAATARPAKRQAERTLRDAGLSRREALAALATRPSTPAAPALRDAVDDGLLDSCRTVAASIRGAVP